MFSTLIPDKVKYKIYIKGLKGEKGDLGKRFLEPAHSLAGERLRTSENVRSL